MPLATVKNVRFSGIATCIPKNEINNLTDCHPAQKSERERLVRNIGIERRRACNPEQCFSDLALEAAETIIQDLNWNKSDIEALIVVTQSPDYLTPSTAIILQDKLGLSHSTIAYDVNLGCSGYPFGLHLLSMLIQSGCIKKGILLVGDKTFKAKDPIFSDAATATALEFDEYSSPIFFDLNSDGSGHKAIYMPYGGHRAPYEIKNFLLSDDPLYKDELRLDGTAVLSFSTKRVPDSVDRLLSYSEIDKSCIDYFIFHQANKIINETLRKKIGIPIEKFPSTLLDLGNTSGASIPVTISVCLREKISNKKAKLLLSGFGIGLSWGSCIIDIDNAFISNIKEV